MKNNKRIILNEYEERIEKARSFEYINWLEQFTIQYPKFTDNHPYLEELNKLDYENITLLNIFFHIIKSYADSNYIKANEHDSSNKSYFIKFNNVGYQIGLIKSSNLLAYCNRSPINNENFIDFEDIINNKKSEKAIEVEIKLQKLVDLINNLANDNTPLDAISNTTKETISKILTKTKK